MRQGNATSFCSARPVQRTGCVLALLSVFAFTLQAGDANLEYQVKAAFLLNFLKFAEWPQDGAQPTLAGTPLVVGILGDDPFGVSLDQTFSGKTVDGRAIHLRRCASEEEAGACHLVFVSAGRKADLEKLQARNVLTVGESGEFLRDGGVIRFVIADERVRFEINLNSADRSRLRISAKLLQLARKVFRKGDLP